MSARNEQCLPVLERAQAIAAEARERIAQKPCDCAECISARNLPGVQRILARWAENNEVTK